MVLFKVLERICLVLWAIAFIIAISCFGMGMMVLFICNAGVELGLMMPIEYANPLVAQSKYCTEIGAVLLPIAIWAWYIGVRFLHFREHDDGLNMDEEP